MVFSTSSRNVSLEHDPNTDLTYLRAECKAADSGEWNSSSICLDEHLGVSRLYKGFDTTEGKTASVQGKSLQSLLEPGSLTLRGLSVLYGRVSGVDGGWEATIYLDLLFNNDNGKLVREGRSTSLMKSAGLIRTSVDGDIMSLLLAPDGKLYVSRMSMRDDSALDNEGRLRPWNCYLTSVEFRQLFAGYSGISGQMRKTSPMGDWQDFDLRFGEQLSNATGSISLEPPSEYVEDEYPHSCHLTHKQGLVSLGFTIIGAEALISEETRTTAQCIYTSTILAGYITDVLFFSRVGAAYGSGLASLAASTVRSAIGPFVSDPKMRDEVAAVALYRVLKEEVPKAAGIGVRNVIALYSGESARACPDQVNCLNALKGYAAAEFNRQGVDSSILQEMTLGWDKILETVLEALINGKSEDDIKHSFDDYTHDGIDLLPLPQSQSPSPPPEKKKDDGTDYIGKWRQEIISVQDQLYLLEPSVGLDVEQSTMQALESIANGLTGLNGLLDFWPDYKGDDATNEQRKAIIQSTTELVAKGTETVKDTEEGNSVLNQVLKLAQNLESLKTQFTEETDAEQAELDKLKPELQAAVEKMFADQKVYQHAQNGLTAEVNKLSEEEHKHGAEATIEDGIRWYKDLLRRRTSALASAQAAADTAMETYLESEQTVVRLQARQAMLNDIHKRRFAVQREITKTEMIIRDLKLMIEGTKREEERILSVVDLMSATLTDLLHIGEPPYHRPNRKIEDQVCTAVLAVHRESLIDAFFVESARKAVTSVLDWFDDVMPEATQREIDAIVKNPLYQQSKRKFDGAAVEKDAGKDV
ncbi:hypothetical protein IFM5058_08775 [Aspergillus udagawae]|nr:hypothetical protein IFM5058_08775 [Aspergillus udagawae]